MERSAITDLEFQQFQRFIFEAAGITMSGAKKALVSGRLANRLAHFGAGSYGEYFRLLKSGAAGDEAQTAVDLLTTNETYFFREPKHFLMLRDHALASRARRQPFRVWSAASSSGEECYSIAMVLADCLGERLPWTVLGSDISTRMLARAQRGHYPIERARHIPPAFLQRYCLKGGGAQEGTMLMDQRLRTRVSFAQINLNDALPRMGTFDAVFLRNVMIYFNADTKREVVLRIAEVLAPGGLLCIGHSESLGEINAGLTQVAPSIYRKS